jgi:dihydroorotase-like cyclic amidohydrolase
MKQFSTTLIKGGTVVNSDRMFKADVLIKDDKVERLLDPKESASISNI